ncbi:hypothetical protein ARNL5_01077 [Anaerolineae bacterium]|nr:hypothetical protein ARNL5_01077 [Anaerolineae bacterium]
MRNTYAAYILYRRFDKTYFLGFSPLIAQIVAKAQVFYSWFIPAINGGVNK